MFAEETQRSLQYSQWGIHWRTPTATFVLFLCGIAFALGHHFYYSYLDGQSNTGKESQEWAVRVGTALAFLARASLVSAAAIAYEQYSWLRFRERPITIGGINSVFAALTNFFALTDFHKFRQAPMSTCLAVVIWYVDWDQLMPTPFSLIEPGAYLYLLSYHQLP